MNEILDIDLIDNNVTTSYNIQDVSPFYCITDNDETITIDIDSETTSISKNNHLHHPYYLDDNEIIYL